jgi:hypothetical protein
MVSSTEDPSILLVVPLTRQRRRGVEALPLLYQGLAPGVAGAASNAELH